MPPMIVIFIIGQRLGGFCPFCFSVLSYHLNLVNKASLIKYHALNIIWNCLDISDTMTYKTQCMSSNSRGSSTGAWWKLHQYCVHVYQDDLTVREARASLSPMASQCPNLLLFTLEMIWLIWWKFSKKKIVNQVKKLKKEAGLNRSV